MEERRRNSRASGTVERKLVAKLFIATGPRPASGVRGCYGGQQNICISSTRKGRQRRGRTKKESNRRRCKVGENSSESRRRNLRSNGSLGRACKLLAAYCRKMQLPSDSSGSLDGRRFSSPYPPQPPLPNPTVEGPPLLWRERFALCRGFPVTKSTTTCCPHWTRWSAFFPASTSAVQPPTLSWSASIWPTLPFSVEYGII